MFSRHTYLVVGLMAAGGAPYLSSQPGVQQKFASWMPAKQESTEEDASLFRFANASSGEVAQHAQTGGFDSASASSAATTASSSASSTNATTSTPATTVGNTRVVSTAASSLPNKPESKDSFRPIDFAGIFRLDINNAWLMKNWPRVSTGLAEEGLHGYRVPLVTGTREDDLAGALTYYYDKNQTIEKLTFHGVTGDPRRLVMFCTTKYALQRETVNDPAVQVYRAASTGSRPSELVVRPARVIRADAPRERFEVDLVLRR